MNITAELERRILKRAQETQKPCKMYKSEAAADKATAVVAENVGSIHETHSARYVVFYIDDLKAWVGAIDLTECLNRPKAVGGYLGYAPQAGFYTY